MPSNAVISTEMMLSILISNKCKGTGHTYYIFPFAFLYTTESLKKSVRYKLTECSQDEQIFPHLELTLFRR